MPATDAVTFDAQFQSPEVTTRWARSSVTSGFGNRTLEITTPAGVQTQSWSEGPSRANSADRQYSAEACAYGGLAGAPGPCAQSGDITGASITRGNYDFFVNSSLLGLGLDGGSVGINTDSPSTNQPSITTGVRCYVDENNAPRMIASRPTGTVQYGASTTLGLVTSGAEVSLSTINNGSTFIDEKGDTLLGVSTSHVQVTPEWGVAPDGRAYSQVRLDFRATASRLLSSYDSGWHTVTFRSECGFTMGSEQPMRLMQAPPQLEMAPPIVEDPPLTSAIGSPQTSGFTTEDSLSWQGGEYHLLATRELDALDRLALEAVLAEIATSGGVERTNWKLFDAPTAGEPVPVVEVVLVDGALAQIRPVVDGVASPVPDVIPTTSITPTTVAPTTSATPTPVATPTPTTTVAPPDEEPGGDGDG
ncbi:hypothetical protein HMPREF0290_0238 [Corynebacterium efficiens YS-314]|uniref:Uncharacterized protein n=1 Tax=Corynebacterium efficiens (strain DSM 44549 / YS-314 / AJ 12310 / JCM 11189 / NBRC 100395) TaxID=196164 RepID=Q8FM76_COREF|nr:hypothetical protein [Corynebacterium efficiens]EEW51158.1 hypothetical protein HMPREF0290_0238 [Corynebacterium efficiens YS-314]BAC19441.1 hypothetical protein [Corynebacterium efficiens YS-314]